MLVRLLAVEYSSYREYLSFRASNEYIGPPADFDTWHFMKRDTEALAKEKDLSLRDAWFDRNYPAQYMYY